MSSSQRTLVHPLLGWISGMCSDELPHTEIDGKVLEAKSYAHDLEAERDRLREALQDLVQEFEAYAGQDAPFSGYYRQANAVLNG